MTIWGTSVFIKINTCFIEIQSTRIYIAFSNGLSSVDPCDYLGTDCYITKDSDGTPFTSIDCSKLVGLVVDDYSVYFAHGDNVNVSGIRIEITGVEW